MILHLDLQCLVRKCFNCVVVFQLPARLASKEAESSTTPGSSGSQTWNPTESCTENPSSSTVWTEPRAAATLWPAPVMMESCPSQYALRVSSRQLNKSRLTIGQLSTDERHAFNWGTISIYTGAKRIPVHWIAHLYLECSEYTVESNHQIRNIKTEFGNNFSHNPHVFTRHNTKCFFPSINFR